MMKTCIICGKETESELEAFFGGDKCARRGVVCEECDRKFTEIWEDAEEDDHNGL